MESACCRAPLKAEPFGTGTSYWCSKCGRMEAAVEPLSAAQLNPLASLPPQMLLNIKATAERADAEGADAEEGSVMLYHPGCEARLEVIDWLPTSRGVEDESKGHKIMIHGADKAVTKCPVCGTVVLVKFQDK